MQASDLELLTDEKLMKQIEEERSSMISTNIRTLVEGSLIIAAGAVPLLFSDTLREGFSDAQRLIYLGAYYSALSYTIVNMAFKNIPKQLGHLSEQYKIYGIMK